MENTGFEHLDRASEAVDSWPEWKKELAGIPYVPQTHPVMVSTIKGRGVAVQVKGGSRIVIPFEHAEATGQAIMISAARKNCQDD